MDLEFMNYLKSVGIDPASYLKIQANYLRFLAERCEESPSKNQYFQEKNSSIQDEVTVKPLKQKARSIYFQNSDQNSFENSEFDQKYNKKHSLSIDEIPIKPSVSFQDLLEKELQNFHEQDDAIHKNNQKYSYLKRNRQESPKKIDRNKELIKRTQEDKIIKKENDLESREILVINFNRDNSHKKATKIDEYRKNQENYVNEKSFSQRDPKIKKKFLKKGDGALCLNKRSLSEVPREKFIEKASPKMVKKKIHNSQTNIKPIVSKQQKYLSNKSNQKILTANENSNEKKNTENEQVKKINYSEEKNKIPEKIEKKLNLLLEKQQKILTATEKILSHEKVLSEKNSPSNESESHTNYLKLIKETEKKIKKFEMDALDFYKIRDKELKDMEKWKEDERKSIFQENILIAKAEKELENRITEVTKLKNEIEQLTLFLQVSEENYLQQSKDLESKISDLREKNDNLNKIIVEKKIFIKPSKIPRILNSAQPRYLKSKFSLEKKINIPKLPVEKLSRPTKSQQFSSELPQSKIILSKSIERELERPESANSFLMISESNTEDIENLGKSPEIVNLSTEKKNEIIETSFTNGVKKEIFCNSTIKLTFPNKDIKQIFSDGKIIYLFHESNASQITYPDGLQVINFANGQHEKHFPDGSKEIYFPDGIVKLIYTDGQEENIFPNGKVQKINAKGKKITKQKRN